MNRRGFLGAFASLPFAALPFVGALVLRRLGETPIDDPRSVVYAKRGELVVCENPNFHVIGVFGEDLCVGDMNWGQKFMALGTEPQPMFGDPLPVRCTCGSRYCDERGRFHFLHDGWREINA